MSRNLEAPSGSPDVEPEVTLTAGQKAAITRARNKALKEATQSE